MRNYFDINSYIKQLNAAVSISTCDPVPVPEISENQNYVFISYSHQDYKQVYADLAVMYHYGVRFWYDRGLVAGKNWDSEVQRIIESPNCVGVIFFLSENLFLSESANKEIDIVTGDKEQLRKNYFCINLSDSKPSHILRNILRMDDEILDHAGLDMGRIAVLANAFSDKMTYLSFSDPGHQKDLIDQIASQFDVIKTREHNRGYLMHKETGEKILITEDNFIVGRTRRKCHYCIENDVAVSTVHFAILSDQMSNLLMDFGSMNGTYINGNKIKGMTPVRIYDLDEITIGTQTLIFHLT